MSDIITNSDNGVETDDIENSNNVLDRYIIPYRHTYKSNIISFSYWNESLKVFVPMSGEFEIMVQAYGQTLNMDRQKRLESFIESIEGSFFIPSVSEISPLFCNGTIKNPSFEMPTRELSHPAIVSFVYYKACAMLGEYADILVFKFIPTFMNTALYIEIPLHQSGNPYIDEDEWLDEMVSRYDDEENEEDIEDLIIPWWHRDDPTTRDYCYGNFSNLPAISIHLDLHDVPDNEFIEYPLYYDEDGNTVLIGDDGEEYQPMKVEDGDIIMNEESEVIIENTTNTLVEEFPIANKELIAKLGKLMNENITIEELDDDIILGSGND